MRSRDERFHSALYRGDLLHARHDQHARRVFRYPVYVAALDLDELPALDRSLRLFSHRRWNLVAFDERDYAVALSPSARATGDLATSLAALRTANGLPAPHATRLVTNLRVAGYVFNPVSFFIDYDVSGAITSVIAEVNNTYGGSFRYVLGSASRLPGDRVGFRHVRELFVSPFLHGPATYDFYFDAPLDCDDLVVEMHVTRGAPAQLGKRLFTAKLSGTRTPLTDRNLAVTALRYPLMTAQVIGLIHFEALKLRLRGVPYQRPERDHRPRAVRR
ncbi:MAG: DUF1365 domain-containing protein [Kofleriaceae bacterium]|nr:DUF1365 domain-containing protein [Kofleriaceae bacterium]